MGRNGGGRGRGVPFYREQRVVCRHAQLSRACAQRTRQGAVAHGQASRARLAMGGRLMRTRSLVTLAVAVVALTVMSGRAAWAQTLCTSDADCLDDGIFCNGTEFCDLGQCASSGDPCVGGAVCNN